jgi:serine/threonine protein kinase
VPLGMLGKYERLDVLGHGASGIVYLAKDTLLGRQIALKEITAQGEDRERVLEEARVLDRLRHPNIVRVYGVDEIGGKIVLAMEYVSGKNLQDVLRRTDRLPLSEAVNVAAQICDGLAFAHQNRIVHRDIKPANILIASDGTVKLVDFGLAQVLGTNSLAGGAGTYAYMAPEDFHEEQQSDHQADIWAVGIILYEMLTGRRPFQAVKAKDPFSWKRAVEETPLAPVTTLRPDAPPALDAILAKALARDKHARYQDAAQMAQDLRALGLEDVPHAPDNGGVGAWHAIPLTNAMPLPSFLTPPELGVGGRTPFPSGATLTLTSDELPLTEIDGFLTAAPDHWEAAREALTSGALALWLTEIDEVPLAAVAREIATSEDPHWDGADDRLRDFLYRAGLDTGPEARRAAAEGAALARSGRFADAVIPLHRAVRLDPTKPTYAQDLAQALRASGDGNGAVQVLEDALQRHPQQRVLQQQHTELSGAQIALSVQQIDFGTLRQGQTRSRSVLLTSAGSGMVEGRIVSAPGWVRVEPPTFATSRRQRLQLTAEASRVGPAPVEYRETVVLDTVGGRQVIVVRASVLPARRDLRASFFWYIPLLVCCLLPAFAGWEAATVVAHGRELFAPGMAASALLCGALFALASAADTTWRLRLLPLFFLLVGLWGASSLLSAFAASTDTLGRMALIQTALPLLVMLTLQSVAIYTDPRGWGRWPLWGWITAATGLLSAYALLHLGVHPSD